jgi:hypothetical protein
LDSPTSLPHPARGTIHNLPIGGGALGQAQTTAGPQYHSGTKGGAQVQAARLAVQRVLNQAGSLLQDVFLVHDQAIHRLGWSSSVQCGLIQGSQFS